MKPMASRKLVWLVALVMMLSPIASTASIVKKEQAIVQLLYCTPGLGCFVAWFYYQEVESVVSAGRLDVNPNGTWGSLEGGEMLAIFEAPAPQPLDYGNGGWGCGDERDAMIQEYADRPALQWLPDCSSFAAGGGTTNFTWGELNQSPGDGHLPCGRATVALTGGLETTRWAYGHAITVSSGYRCPVGNTSVGGALLSQHQFGDAADIFGTNGSWTETHFNSLKAMADSYAGATFSMAWNDYSDHHLHVDWR